MPPAKIVVATDLSARSDRAVDRAIRLGNDLKSPVTLVHVTHPKSKATEAEVKALVRSTLPKPEMDIEIVLPSGSPPQAIAKTVESLGAQLVVVGVARFNHITDFVLGTAVDYILRHCEVPVLVVKQRPHADYRKILVPVDFSPWSRNALLTVAGMFPAAEISVLHAYHVPYEGLQRDPHVRSQTLELKEEELEKFLSDPDIPADVRTRTSGQLGYGDIGKVLGDTIGKFSPDLIAMGTHGTGTFRHATIGSTASSLLEWVSPDTLMVPAKA